MARRGAMLGLASIVLACGGETVGSSGNDGSVPGGGASGAGGFAQGGGGGAGGAGGSVQGGGGGAGGSVQGGSAGVGGSAGGVGGFAGAGSGGSAGSADCSKLVDSIVPQVAGKGDCTTVVRAGYLSHAIASHAFVCGPHKSLDELQARAVANADSGYGSGKQVAGFWPKDEWIFYVSPGDFGGVSIVSARNGLSVFGASIVWMGTGKVLHPKAWSTAPLGASCPKQPKPPVRGFDLSADAPPLAPEKIGLAMSLVWDTALPEALAKSGTVLDAVVLLYAPSVGFTAPGGFDNASAEYVVLINSG